MRLFDIMSVISGDEVVRIINDGDETLFYGKARNAYFELDADVLKSKKVYCVYYYVCNGFGGLYIEVN